MLSIVNDHRSTADDEKRTIEAVRHLPTRSTWSARCQSEGGEVRELDRHGRCGTCGSDHVTEFEFRWLQSGS